MRDEPYIAVFCPSCGVHINDFDTQDSPDAENGFGTGPQRLGSLYTCGWCGIRTFDWNHVHRCRATWPVRQALASLQATADREEVRQRLSRMVIDLEDAGG